MTMILYGSPGSCSLSPHIALREAGLAFELLMVDLPTGRLPDGRDFRTEVNTKGYVPVLELADGQRLTEGPAIVQYIADLVPETRLAPPAGTLARYRLQEWLTFTNSELHKAFAVLARPDATDHAKQQSRATLRQRLAWVDAQLAAAPCLLGDDFSVADAYLFVVAGWSRFVDIDLSALPALTAYLGRIAARPAVQAAMRAEGLIS